MAKTVEIELDMTPFDLYVKSRKKSVAKALVLAVTQEIQIAFRLSQRTVPVKTGTLKNSGSMTPAKQVSEYVVESSITYGGAASAYAKIINNNRTLRHPNGGSAGYATDPVLLRMEEIRKGIARRISAALK